jgi:hypothetical protein
MQNAYQRIRKYDSKGKCTEDQMSIGGIVPTTVSVLVGLVLGKTIPNPSGFLELAQRLLAHVIK